MVSLFIKGIFWLVSKLYTLILSPAISLLFGLIPGGDTYFTNIANFIATGIQYFSLVSSYLLIPSTALALLVAYFEVKIAIIVAIKLYALIVNLWVRLAP